LLQVMPAKDALFDVVICDGAPNVGGAWSREAYTQAALILDACKLATEFLAPRGMFITKVFRSSEYHALLYSFQQLFDRVESTKPMASRSTSAEIYVVCKGYKAPAKIDKRLLDPACLFAEARKSPPSHAFKSSFQILLVSPRLRTWAPLHGSLLEWGACSSLALGTPKRVRCRE
jgi:hypothetical protein